MKYDDFIRRQTWTFAKTMANIPIKLKSIEISAISIGENPLFHTKISKSK